MPESTPATTGGSRSNDADERPSGAIGEIGEIAARNAVPVAVTWILVSVVVATYRRRDVASLVTTWAIAVPVALLVRTWWVGSPQGGRIAVFLVVGSVFAALFLLGGRGVVWAVTRSSPDWHDRS